MCSPFGFKLAQTPLSVQVALPETTRAGKPDIWSPNGSGAESTIHSIYESTKNREHTRENDSFGALQRRGRGGRDGPRGTGHSPLASCFEEDYGPSDGGVE